MIRASARQALAGYRERASNWSLDAADDPLSEQAFGPDEQEHQGENVREPAFDAAADHGPDVDLGELLGRADDEPADDGAGHRSEAAENQHGQRLQRHERQRELHAVARAPQQPRDERDEAGDRPDDRPDVLE